MVLLVAAALAVCVTSCGEGGGSTAVGVLETTTSSSADPANAAAGRSEARTAEAPSAPGGSSDGEAKGEHENQDPIDNQGMSHSKKSPHSPSTSSAEATDPPTPGFEDASGQTHIPAFGVEASSDERADVEITLNAYLHAGGAGEWSKACSYLDRSVAGELSTFAKESNPDAGLGCATSLPRILELSSNYQDPYFGPARLSGLRIKEGAGAGFALFHGDDGRDYWVAVKVDNGRWKILSTVPTSLTR